jgi:DNA-binding GntR family transcriptional regulator
MYNMSTMSAVMSSSAEAYRMLRRAIIRVDLAPGAIVSESQLAERFGMSMAAVRAALARLRAEGLLLAEPRRGHVVAPVTMRDVIEIYDVRELLEPPGAAAAAGHMPADQLIRLRRLCQPVPDLEDAASAEHFLQANRAIHVAIAEASGNRRLAAMVAQLLDGSERARLLALRAGAADHGLRARAEHHDLLSAIEHADSRAAHDVMATAIQTFRDELIEALRATTLDTPLGGVWPGAGRGGRGTATA